MDGITQYLDYIFDQVADRDTPQVQATRTQIHDQMSERVQALVDSGVDEDSALSTVISQFGTPDELAASFGLEALSPSTPKRDVVPEEFTVVDLQCAQRVLDYRRERGQRIALASALCVIAFIPIIVLELLAGQDGAVTVTLALCIGGAAVIVCFAVAAYLFIADPHRREFSEWKRTRWIADAEARAHVREQRDRFTPSFSTMTVSGATGCVIATVLIVLTGFIDPARLPYALPICFGVAGVILTVSIYVLVRAQSFRNALNLIVPDES